MWKSIKVSLTLLAATVLTFGEHKPLAAQLPGLARCVGPQGEVVADQYCEALQEPDDRPLEEEAPDHVPTGWTIMDPYTWYFDGVGNEWPGGAVWGGSYFPRPGIRYSSPSGHVITRGGLGGTALGRGGHVVS